MSTTFKPVDGKTPYILPPPWTTGFRRITWPALLRKATTEPAIRVIKQVMGFRRFLLRGLRAVDALQEFLDVTGRDKQEKVIAVEVELILESDTFREPDVEFLVSIGKSDKAEEYLIARADRINVDYYTRLLPLAKAMESENRNLAASLLYRSLLVSILERSYTKAYSHGVRYLKKLDSLAAKTTDWKNFEDHEAFKNSILQTHGRKKSFWSKYEVK